MCSHFLSSVERKSCSKSTAMKNITNLDAYTSHVNCFDLPESANKVNTTIACKHRYNN